jgi:hypothetical protein
MDVKTGMILSETSFFKVVKVNKNDVVVKDEMGNEVAISNAYVDAVLNSADEVTSEEKKTITELADIFVNGSRIAMTVAFFKKANVKTKTAYNKEVKVAIDIVQNAKVSEVEGLLTNLIENPITKEIPGELRVMKGRHYGSMDDLGRIQFIDMEQDRGTKDWDGRVRQVDPRTIQYVIVDKVKYTLKK